MKNWNVVVLPGDGTGPELIVAGMDVLNTVNEKFNLGIGTVMADAGENCVKKYGTNLPTKTISLLKSSDCVIKGPMSTSGVAGSAVSCAVKIRKMFDLYANVRPAKNIPGVNSVKSGIDLVIVRENTEGMYSGIDRMVSKDKAVAERVITRQGSARVGKFALELAKMRRKHLTIVHKANILKVSDGLFRDTILKEAKKFKGIRVDEAHADAMAQWLIKNPQDYDVIVTENMFGDILSDESAMMVGGVGVGASANIGKKYAMFEPIHGSAPKYAGMDRVNPIATIMSIKMMLDWMGYPKAALAVEKAVIRSIKVGVKTVDLGGNAKCSKVGRYIASLI